MADNPSSSSVGRADLRAFPRFRVNDAPAVIYPEKFLNKLGLGRGNRSDGAVNLSEGGVLVSLMKPIEEGTRVRVRVEVAEFNDVIECAGEIRWCKEAVRTGKFYAGIRFLDLSPEGVKRITHLRKALSSPEYRSKQGSGTRRYPKPPAKA
jgi:hypothetical protein